MRSGVIYILLVLNAVSFLLFAVDKMLAIKGMRRIPERVLILSALCFGGVGTLASMYTFHHKTKKTMFILLVPVLTVVQVGAMIWLNL